MINIVSAHMIPKVEQKKKRLRSDFNSQSREGESGSVQQQPPLQTSDSTD